MLNKEILGKKRGEGVKAIKNEVGRLLYGVEAANYMNSYYAEMGKAGAGSRWYKESMNADEFSFIEMPEVERLRT